MAVFQCTFNSNCLRGRTQFRVIIPAQPSEDEGALAPPVYREGKRYRTLYLLHGYSGDEGSWLNGSGIDRYAEEYDMAVIMPDGRNSFYCDYGAGHEYYSYITEELIDFAQKMFPLLTGSKDRFVAGFSMGGYGALKIGLSRPDLFSAAAGLSSAVDIQEIVKDEAGTMLDFEKLFGDLNRLDKSPHNLYHLLESNRENLRDLRIYQACGTEDFLYEMNRDFRDYMDKTGLDFTYEEGPGEHDWTFWDRYIQNVLAWINRERAESL